MSQVSHNLSMTNQDHKPQTETLPAREVHWHDQNISPPCTSRIPAPCSVTYPAELSLSTPTVTSAMTPSRTGWRMSSDTWLPTAPARATLTKPPGNTGSVSSDLQFSRQTVTE